jgi:nitrile hydratase
MNGVHDMGGMHGMGPILREENEPVFHHEWERRAFALTLAAAFLGEWNIDMGRHSRERMPPARYLAASYYEKWLYGLELLLVERGLVTREEIVAGRPRGGGPEIKEEIKERKVLKAEDVEPALKTPRGFRLSDEIPPRFKQGDHVLARNNHPEGHTRLPRYARGKRGIIDRDHGVFIFADANAMSLGKKPQHLYSVRFAATELWGPAASSRDSINIDLWNDHLDPL